MGNETGKYATLDLPMKEKGIIRLSVNNDPSRHYVLDTAGQNGLTPCSEKRQQNELLPFCLSMP